MEGLFDGGSTAAWHPADDSHSQSRKTVRCAPGAPLLLMCTVICLPQIRTKRCNPCWAQALLPGSEDLVTPIRITAGTLASESMPDKALEVNKLLFICVVRCRARCSAQTH